MSWVPRLGAGGSFLRVISWKILDRKSLQELAYGDMKTGRMSIQRAGRSESGKQKEVSNMGLDLAQDWTGQQLVLQELWRQGVDVNSVEEGVKVLGPTLHVPADPVGAGLVHLQEKHRLTWKLGLWSYHVKRNGSDHAPRTRTAPWCCPGWWAPAADSGRGWRTRPPWSPGGNSTRERRRMLKTLSYDMFKFRTWNLRLPAARFINNELF